MHKYERMIIWVQEALRNLPVTITCVHRTDEDKLVVWSFSKGGTRTTKASSACTDNGTMQENNKSLLTLR